MANLYLPALSPVAKALRGAGSHDFPAQTNVADFEALGRYGIFCYFPLHEGKGEPRDVFNYITDMATFSQNNGVFAWRSEADYGYLPSQGVGPKDISVPADWACGYESASAVVDKFNGRTELSFFATVRLRNGNAAWHNAAASFETIVFRANGVFALDLMGGDENGLDLRYLLATSGTSGWTASNDKQADEWELGTGQGGKEFLLCGTWDGSTLSYYFGTLDNFQKVGTATVTGSIDDAVPTGKLYIGGVNYASTLGVPGLVTGCGISNRCLSEAEVISLFRHREKFLKPANQSPYLFSIPAAGGGGETKTVAVDIAAAATVAATPTKLGATKTAAVAITAASAVAVVPTKIGATKTVAAAISAASTVAVTPTKLGALKTATVSIAASSTVTVDTVATRTAEVSIAASSAVAITPTKVGATKTVAVAISASSTVTAAVQALGALKTVAVAIAASATVAVVPAAIRGVEVLISATSSAAIDAVKTAVAQVSIAAQSLVNVAVTSVGTKYVTVGVSGTSTVSITAFNTSDLWTPVSGTTDSWSAESAESSTWIEVT